MSKLHEQKRLSCLRGVFPSLHPYLFVHIFPKSIKQLKHFRAFIYTLESSANAQQIDLDVSGIDFTKYAMVQVFAYNLLSTPAGTLKTLYAKINDGGAYLTSIDGYATTSQAYIGRTYSPSSANLSYTSFLKIELADFPDILPASYYPVSIRCSARWYNADFKIEESGGTKFINTAINTLNFVISDSTFYINSGARFLVYGVKK